jgi:osmotically-inducible protein OsmY
MLIDTHVTDGNVRLTGSVSSAAEKSQAYLDAWVVGVQSVSVRDLEVAWRLRDEMRRKRTPLVDSDKIRQAIKLAFSYDPRVEIKDLDINVIGGVVTLSGIVDNLKAKQAAARDAKNTTGVVDVKNHLKVRPPKRLSDKDLTTAARELLKRNAHLARLDITASARDGKVYLEGVVPSVFDKKLAENMVTNITGIQAIGNNLVVNSPRQIKPDWKILTALEERLYWNPMLDSFKIKPSVEGGVAVLRGEVDNWRERVTAGMEARKAGAWRVRNMLRIRPLRLQDKKPGKMGKPEKQNPKKVIPGAPPAAQPEPIEK